ncbi:FAD dependent oxidoreductase [Hortaea werneckii]|nr:FAD dependent oxidoreductase [Hortaea werneckii]
MEDTVAVVGSGIVGSALAAFLSEKKTYNRILLIDRSISHVLGSTAYAPGFLGQFNQNTFLTQLAVDSLKDYDQFPDVFERTGGLELAATDAGISMLEERCKKANAAGISASMLPKEDFPDFVPDFVSKDSFSQALYFPTDGVADPEKLCLIYRNIAREKGVTFLEANVKRADVKDGAIHGLELEDGTFIRAGKVIFATGIWTASLTSSELDLPIPTVPVAHPYVYTERAGNRRQSPFCRWPEAHVYARDHGDRYGLGSYDHAPIRINSLGVTASNEWSAADFATTISHAVALKVASSSQLSKLVKCKSSLYSSDESGERKVNGIFSVTPDGLPLLGPTPGVANCWLAAGIWITHAAGCARLLGRMIQGEDYDTGIASALDPARFVGSDAKELEAKALRQYNDIYLSKRGT